MSIYPISEIISEGGSNMISQLILTISGYLLPFFLYVFLSVLMLDLFLLANLALKILPVEKRKSLAFKKYTFSEIIVLSILVVIAGSINLNTICVSQYRIEVPKKKSNRNHLRIAFVADFHIQKNIPHSFVNQFVNKVNALKPDIMLYGGDILEGDSENESSVFIESSLRKVVGKYGSFGVPGNHEFHKGQEKNEFFEKSGITMLCDTIIIIDSSFYLAGRNDQHIGKRKTINQIIDKTALDLPIILMDHRPTELQQVSNTKVDIQFSGHTHNGQLFPLNLIIDRIYELSWGYRKIRNTHFFVTSGLRLWGPPIKTSGKSEIMLVDVYFNHN
jgi:predicted MPP superfamily phosphohydrolase